MPARAGRGIRKYNMVNKTKEAFGGPYLIHKDQDSTPTNKLITTFNFDKPMYESIAWKRLIRWLNIQHCGTALPPLNSEDVSKEHLDASYAFARSVAFQGELELQKDGSFKPKAVWCDGIKYTLVKDV